MWENKVAVRDSWASCSGGSCALGGLGKGDYSDIPRNVIVDAADRLSYDED